jgi:hypothetical protein
MRLHIRKSRTSSRADRKSVSAHQAAMAALGKDYDQGYDFQHGEDQIGWPEARRPDSRGVDLRSKTVPGQGHVVEYYPNIAPSGRYRGLNTVKGGTAGIEPKVVDRHKPTEDF